MSTDSTTNEERAGADFKDANSAAKTKELNRRYIGIIAVFKCPDCGTENEEPFQMTSSCGDHSDPDRIECYSGCGKIFDFTKVEKCITGGYAG